MLALSLSPAEALAYLSGIHTTLLVWDRIPQLLWQLEADDRLLIHTLGFPDHPAEVELCEQILAEFGFDVDTFPAWAIQGLATVDEVLLYDGDGFAEDAALHGCGDDLFSYQSSVGKENSLCYGIRLTDTFFLDEPIYDVLPPLQEDWQSQMFWQPESDLQHFAFRCALIRDRAMY